MNDDLHSPIGVPPDNDGADEGEITEEDYEEVEDMDEELNDEGEDKTA